MRKTCFLITFLINSFLSYSQTIKKPKPESKVVWTWNGVEVNEKTLKDSLKVFYFKYIDSVKSSNTKF